MTCCTCPTEINGKNSTIHKENRCIGIGIGDKEARLQDARIKKIDDGDHYHLVIHGEFTHIDEEVDGPKLLAILSKEKLIGMTLADVLSLLDVANPGYEMAVSLQERKLG